MNITHIALIRLMDEKVANNHPIIKARKSRVFVTGVAPSEQSHYLFLI
jgi:hypothetical protein